MFASGRRIGESSIARATSVASRVRPPRHSASTSAFTADASTRTFASASISRISQRAATTSPRFPKYFSRVVYVTTSGRWPSRTSALSTLNMLSAGSPRDTHASMSVL